MSKKKALSRFRILYWATSGPQVKVGHRCFGHSYHHGTNTPVSGRHLAGPQRGREQPHLLLSSGPRGGEQNSRGNAAAKPH